MFGAKCSSRCVARVAPLVQPRTLI